MAAETLDREDICKHFRGTCLLFNASPYEYSRCDLDKICQDIHSKGIGNERTIWEMYSSSSGLSCFTVLLPVRTKTKRGRTRTGGNRERSGSHDTGQGILTSFQGHDGIANGLYSSVTEPEHYLRSKHLNECSFHQFPSLPVIGLTNTYSRQPNGSAGLTNTYSKQHNGSAYDTCSGSSLLQSSPQFVVPCRKQASSHAMKDSANQSRPSSRDYRSYSDLGVVSDMTRSSSDTYQTLSSSSSGSNTTDIRYCSTTSLCRQMATLGLRDPSLPRDICRPMNKESAGYTSVRAEYIDHTDCSNRTQRDLSSVGDGPSLTCCDFQTCTSLPRSDKVSRSFSDSSHLIDPSLSQSFMHSMYQPSPREKKWNIITLGLRLDKINKKVCPCYKVYSVSPSGWLPAGMARGKHKGRTSQIAVREVINEYLRELEKFGKYKKIGRNCSDFAATFINLMSYSEKERGKVSGVGVMCEACHRSICKCCC